MTNQLPSPHTPIAVLGAGAWGTALALSLARRGQTVTLWSIEVPEVALMKAEKTNRRYLPGFDFPDTIHPTDQLSEAIQHCDDILMVVPSVGYRDTLNQLKPLLSASHRIISATKGIDAGTGKLPHEMVLEVLGEAFPFAALSGPSFANEVAIGLPTAVDVASHDKGFSKDIAARFHSSVFKVYVCDDVLGVELGGVVKNIMAIAIGICDGLGFGADARCALLSHGLNEIIRLGVVMGAEANTFTGLSGMGDLILTCLDNQSRNRRFGLAIGQGRPIDETERTMGHVVEGKRNAPLILQLAKKHGVDMPICQVVSRIIQGELAVSASVIQELI